MTVEPGGSPTPMSERMQSLLSRAVEDQLSEQRQLAGALTEVRNQLARLGQEIESMRSGAPDGNVEMGLGALSGEVREAVRLLGERVDAVGGLVQQRGTDLAEVRAAIADLEATTRSHTDALGGISGGLAALPAYGDRIGGLQDNVTGLHERLAAVDGVAAAVTTLQQRIDTMDKDLRELRSAFTGIGARMAELPGRGDLDAAVARGAEPLGDIGARLGGLEASLAAVGARLDEDPDTGDADDGRDEWLRQELARFADSMTERTESVGDRLA